MKDPNDRSLRRLLSLTLVASLVLATSLLLYFQYYVGPRRGAETTAPADGVATATAFEQDGFRVEMSAASLTDPRAPIRERENADVRFAVREAGPDGKPLTGLRPLSWIVARKEGEALPERAAARRQIQDLLAGRLASNADVNLNQYYLVTLDDNASISIIDPQIEDAKTKMIGMVALPAKGTDFVLSPDRRHVLVTVGEAGKVAFADIDRSTAALVDVGGSPSRIALQPDGRYAWVSDESAAAVTVLDVTQQSLAKRLETGPGPHSIAFRSDSRFAYVASPASTTLDVVDVHALSRVASVEVGKGAVGVIYSPHSRQVYVGLVSGTVVVVDGDRFTRSATIDLPPGLSGLAMPPEGRFGFAIHRSRAELVLFETSSNRRAFTIPTEKEPDRVDFTDTFAYVRHAGSELMVLVDLATLGHETTPVATTVVLGQRPPTAGGLETIAPMLAATPEGGGAMVLNPADRSIYHFMEGMTAPMGSYPMYPWTGRGLLLVDRTIREKADGVYTARFRAPRAGSYTVVFLVPGSPQLYGAFDLSIAPATVADPTKPQLTFEPIANSDGLPANVPTTIAIRLSESASGAPVSDLRDLFVLVFRGTRFEWREVARPLEDGRYEVPITFPESGQYTVMVSCRSRGIRFGDLPQKSVSVAAATSPAQKERS